MADLPSMPFYVSDFEADTSHLTLEEDGAYNRLLRLCWLTPGCSIPADPKWIARRMRVSDADFERVVKPVIDEFFRSSKGRIWQKRQQQEFMFAIELMAKRKQAGMKGGTAKALRRKDIDPSKALASKAKATPIEKTEAKASSKKIGCRLPEDFKPDREWSLAQGLPVDVLQRELDQFRDYWTAKSGKDATKLDWQATWRTWVRNTKARQGGINGRVKPKTQGEALRDMARERLSNGSGSQTGRLDFGDGARQTESSVDDLRLALSANLGRKAG